MWQLNASKESVPRELGKSCKASYDLALKSQNDSSSEFVKSLGEPRFGGDELASVSQLTG